MSQRILVVDDDKKIVRLVRAYLEQAGFQVFTAYDGGTALHIIRIEDADKIVGLELGADDYITKPFNPREVVARVRAVLRRAVGGPAQPKVLQLGGLLMDLDQHEVLVDGRLVDLTPTEFELLRALMENPSHAFTRSELIEKSLGYTYEGLDRTLDSHIKNLRRKIEPNPAEPTYIQTVYGVGYRLRPEQPFDGAQDRVRESGR
jgi:two-component system alkaline phosphatase synthesis response regulator PhoP